MSDAKPRKPEAQKMDIFQSIAKNPKLVAVVLCAFLLSGGNIAQLIRPGSTDSEMIKNIEEIKKTTESIKQIQTINSTKIERIEKDVQENRKDIKSLLTTDK